MAFLYIAYLKLCIEPVFDPVSQCIFDCTREVVVFITAVESPDLSDFVAVVFHVKSFADEVADSILFFGPVRIFEFDSIASELLDELDCFDVSDGVDVLHG